MLNNHQRPYVGRHGSLYPQYGLASPFGRYDFGHVDHGVGAYRQEAQQSIYSRDDFTHLAPQMLPTQQQQQQLHSSALAQSYAATHSHSHFVPFEHSLTYRARHPQQPLYHPVPDAVCAPPIMDDEQLAQMQQLSATFEPEVKGPLASELQSSNILVEEYANADPTYRKKTLSLASTYSNIRTIRGDGQCGWRAIAVGYFERLLSARDPNLLLQEEARLRSLVNIVKTSGIDPDLYEDFAYETITLMRELSTGIRNGSAEGILLARFNDEHTQNYIITHLKSLTTAWLKTHFDEYSNFIVKDGLETYCEQQIMPIKSEIDQIGLMALKDVLLSPAGIGLEVEYLDLSPGHDGTLHRFTSPGQSIHLGVLRLLYRPGHYDILYKSEDLNVPTVSAYFQLSSRTHDEHILPLSRPDFMSMIPGMSTVLPGQGGWQATPHYDMSSLFDIPPGPPSVTSTMPLPVIAPKAAIRSVQQHNFVTPQPAQMIASQDSFADPIFLDSSTIRNMSSQMLDVGTPFRLTDWHHKQDSEQPQAQLQTAQFRNSHYNTAHFNNPDFQPETWSPDKEEKKALEDALGQISRVGKYRRTK